MFQAVIFDMDGVIVDSEYTFLESKTKLLNDAGYKKDISYQYQFMGTTFEFMWQKMKEELSLPLPVQEYITEMNKIREKMMERDGIKPIAHTISVIKKLHEAGLKLAIASSSPKAEIVKIVKALTIEDYFQVLVSSEECQHSKPAPDVFLKAANELGYSPDQCLVIEDSMNGVLAAKAAEMYCIGFANPDYPVQDLSSADKIIQSFIEFPFEVLK